MTEPLDLARLRVLPLRERRSLSRVDDILVDPDARPPPVDGAVREDIERCAERIRSARARSASVILAYGAHLLRNGAAPILGRMMERNRLTHLATNGAGTIHDWEYAWLGRSTECVRENIASGTFGAWDETGRYLHLALMAGSLDGEGYGRSLGRFITEDGFRLPDAGTLGRLIRDRPEDPLTPVRADLLQALRRHRLPSGRIELFHAWKHASILGRARVLGVPVSVHPGIGYDIISCHPVFDGAVIGRAAAIDFRLFCTAVANLSGGVMLSVGSAVMAPQVFEKSLSCVNNLRLQEGQAVVGGHEIFVVDLQRGGRWDWSRGEPPRTSPDYYLRFCKSFSRTGGRMHYTCCDNVTFLHHLCRILEAA